MAPQILAGTRWQFLLFGEAAPGCFECLTQGSGTVGFAAFGELLHYTVWLVVQILGPISPSHDKLDGLGCYVNIRIAGVEGVVVGEDHVFGAVVAEGGFVVAADDGEGVEDVVGVVAGEAVEVEVEGVEAGAQVAALLLRSR